MIESMESSTLAFQMHQNENKLQLEQKREEREEKLALFDTLRERKLSWITHLCNMPTSRRTRQRA